MGENMVALLVSDLVSLCFRIWGRILRLNAITGHKKSPISMGLLHHSAGCCYIVQKRLKRFLSLVRLPISPLSRVVVLAGYGDCS